eukprot:765981-Hanusia_phi.AAC.5
MHAQRCYQREFILHLLLSVFTLVRPIFISHPRTGDMLPSRLALRGGSTDIAQKRTFEEFNSSHSETAGRKKRVEGPQRGMKEFDLDVPLRKSRGGNGSEFSLDSQASIPTELVENHFLTRLSDVSKVDNQYRLQHGVNASLNISDDRSDLLSVCSEGVWTNVALVNNTSKKAAVSDEEESCDAEMRRGSTRGEGEGEKNQMLHTGRGRGRWQGKEVG